MELEPKESVISPKMKANIGRAIPFTIAAVEPIIIKTQSVIVANLNSRKKDTLGNSSFFSFFPSLLSTSMLSFSSSLLLSAEGDKI